PFMWMDRALSKYRGIEDPSQWIDDALALADACRSVNGLWVGIWHPNLVPALGFPGAPHAYRRLVNSLVEREPWVAPNREVSVGIVGKVTMLSYLAAALLAARRIMRQQSFDAIHAHWWFPAGLVAETLRRLYQVPFLITMHGSDLRLTRNFPMGQALFRSVAR